MDEKRTPKISIGITSLTVILCVLCLTVFSVLTLSTAVSERNFSMKRAEAAKNYYATEAEAAALVNEIQSAWSSGKDIQQYLTQGKITVDGTTYSFYKTIDERQALFVSFSLADSMDIQNWQVVSTAEWTPDESLKVWDGENLTEE